MKAKYKLGSMVEVGQAGKPAFYGKVAGVYVTDLGVSYALDEAGTSPSNFVNEGDIVNSFRPTTKAKARVAKTGKKGATRSKAAQEQNSFAQ